MLIIFELLNIFKGQRFENMQIKALVFRYAGKKVAHNKSGLKLTSISEIIYLFSKNTDRDETKCICIFVYMNCLLIFI